MGPVARRPSPRRAAGAGIPDGLLVRRPARDGWLRGLPSSAGPGEVTVSLTHRTEAMRHAAELTARGYRPVGAAGCADGDGNWADFLVPRALGWDQPEWVRALAGSGGRVYDAAMGPVRTTLASVLAAHRD